MVKPVGDVVLADLGLLDERRNRRLDPGVRTGFPALDCVQGGLRPGGITLVTSPRRGLTSAFLDAVIWHSVVERRVAALLVSNRIEAETWVNRQLASAAGVSELGSPSQRLKASAGKRIEVAAAALHGAPLVLDDSCPSAGRELSSVVREAAAELRSRKELLRLVIIDDLAALTEAFPIRRRHRREAGAELSAIAQSRNVAILVGCSVALREKRRSRFLPDVEGGLVTRAIADTILLLDEPEESDDEAPPTSLERLVPLSILKDRLADDGLVAEYEFDSVRRSFSERHVWRELKNVAKPNRIASRTNCSSRRCEGI